MNPYATAEGRAVMAYIGRQNELSRLERDIHRAALHRKAVERRRKAKRGGKR